MVGNLMYTYVGLLSAYMCMNCEYKHISAYVYPFSWESALTKDEARMIFDVKKNAWYRCSNMMRDLAAGSSA